MNEYIITIPDSCFPSSDTYRDIYYPDERHNPMPLEEIVRCRDCEHYREEYEECMRGEPTGNVVIFDCESHDFCSFGKRKEGGDD